MVQLRDIQDARSRIASRIVLTPCTPSDAFGELFGGRAWFKFESLQRTGSFKARGALNRLLLLTASERAQGVITASAGNHAQGVAYHAGRLNIPATIVMPERTPLIKVSNTERFGAQAVLHGHNYDEAMAEALRRRDAEAGVLIHPFDDEAVIAGQGTVGLELLEQIPEVNTVVVPIGGGGLAAGIAVAIKEQRPDIRIVGVEAAAVPAALRAREHGARVTIPAGDTIAEGAAAAAVAATVQGTISGLADCNVVMLLSGGNIDVNLLSRIVERGLIKDGRLAHFRVRLKDRPGALASLTTLLASHGANILRLDHRRGTDNLWVTEADVALTLEMRGRTHVEELVALLQDHGYSVRQE